MGQLFTRISTNSSDEPVTENSSIVSKPMITKRKHFDSETTSKRRKFESRDRLPLSPRISKSSHLINRSFISHSFSPMAAFKCQLCRRCFANKDSYLDHMILCAMERHASIKIVRATKTYAIQL